MMEPYSTLVNRKLLMPSTQDNYFVIEKQYLISVLSSSVGEIFVDENWYAERYPDVVLALNNGTIKSISEHYTRFGYFEHRMPYNITVDEKWYLSQYEDVNRAVFAKIYPSGQIHFEECGYKEGRVPYPNFRLKSRNLKSD